MRAIRRQRPSCARGLAGATAALLALAPCAAYASSEPEPNAPPAAAAAEPDAPAGPPDAYSRGTPRGTMRGFFTATRARNYERAAKHLDLRGLPPDARDTGPELARWLKVVLDQTIWVDLAFLSNSNAGVLDDDLPAWQERLGEIDMPQGRETLLLQRVPREGDLVRIWKISSATVARIPDLYAAHEPVWLEEWLPAFFFEHSALDVPYWKWLGLGALLLGAWLVAVMIAGTTTHVLGSIITRRSQAIDMRIVDLVSGPVRLAWTVVVFMFAQRPLGLPIGFASRLSAIQNVLLVAAFAWLVFRLIDLGALALRIRAERRSNQGLIPALLPLSRFAKILIVLFGTLGVLGTLGVNITAAMAGLGVGGIAIALAAQKSLENLFGGLSLFIDRPVKVGDYFRYGQETGTVEEIGLRSTRIRTRDRTVVTIPNGEFSNLQLENFAVRDMMRLHTIIGVRYETTSDQLRYVLARLREILLAHPRITEDPARVRFVGFGAYSLDLEVFAYVDTTDWSEFLSVREDIFLRFMDAIKESGTGFAFPSTTTYLGRDDGMDEEKIREIEARVNAWRAKGELPFPAFPHSVEESERDSLDWPPSGSPDAAKR